MPQLITQENDKIMTDNNDWLQQVTETPLEPERPIIDPHHHLFIQRPNTEPDYFVPKFAADIDASGHNIIASVYIECNAMYRKDGPDARRPLGAVSYTHLTLPTKRIV